MADPDAKMLRDKERGQRAKLLLENPLLIEAFDTLEASYIEAWKTNGASLTSPSDKFTRVLDEAGRDRLWMAVQVLGKVRGHLTKVMQDGKTAEQFIAADDLK